MQTKYMFEVDAEGRVRAGTTMRYPDNYNVEGTEDVWEAQNRAVYDAETSAWTIHEPLTLNAPASAGINEEITVTVTLPEQSPDNEVRVAIMYNQQEMTSAIVPVTDGQASQTFAFDVPGMYTIVASSSHHGSAGTGVTVDGE